MNPSVRCLGKVDKRIDAWKISRPGFNHSNVNIEEIGIMDLSLNSLAVYTLEITSSILFRDFMFSLRPIHPWARSLRSAPLKRKYLSISEELANDIDESFINQTIELIESGVEQDIARENLPMSLSTTYVVSIDHRTLVGFLKSMLTLDEKLFQIYGYLFLNALPELRDFDKSNTKEFSNSYLITDDEYNIDGTAEVGSMIAGNFSMKSAMAAQFLRQHNAKVKTEIWNAIKNGGYYNISLQQKDKIDVVFYTDKSAYHRLMQLRSHWFADWSDDMWGNMVGDYISDMSVEQFWDFIPNGNGKQDPYHRDMLSRINGEEHNLPCPIMCEWPDLVNRRLQDFGDNKIIRKYQDLCESGYIKNNVNNQYRMAYIDMLTKRRTA